MKTRILPLRSRCFWLVLLLVAALASGGCGDDDGNKDLDTTGDASEDTDATGTDTAVEDTATADTGADTQVSEDTAADTGGDDATETSDDTADTADTGPAVDCGAIGDSITSSGLLAHLQQLEDIATANGGNRASGSAGWDATLTYAKTTLEAAGFVVVEHDVTYPYEHENSAPVLARVTPTAHTYTLAANDAQPTGDFQRMHLSVSGNLTGVGVTAVDLALGPDNTSSSGCEAADFTDFPAGNIALLQRGTCFFVDKAINAQTAGASAVIIFNQGNTDDRKDLFVGGVGFLAGDDFQVDHGVTIPGLFATYAVGEELAGLLQNGAVTLNLVVDNTYELRTTKSLVAETTAGNAAEVVMVGAHLDSVPEGPGINDNGTGVATVLELARLSAECTPSRKLRFALWGAEESGLWGSKYYLLGLTQDDLDKIHAYLNVDVLGSKNYAIMLYDGDGSEFGAAGGAGSDLLEQFLASELTSAGYTSVPYFDINSDHFPFFLMGKAFGGIYTGTREIKSADEATAFGGTADAAYDSCNHQACDDVSNVDLDLTTDLARIYADTVQHFGIDGASTVP